MLRSSTIRTIAVGAALAIAAGCVGEYRAQAPTKIVLIGGAPSEGPGHHAYPDGIRALKAILESSPDFAALHGEVVAYPDGWPADPSAFDGATTMLWYFDGLDRHPLRDPTHRAQFDAAMRRGVGLVVLHQASTVPANDDLGLTRTLGGVRVGTFDRTTEWATLDAAIPAHPVVRGITSFDYRDEFYPTIRFGPKPVTPLLEAALHVQFRDGRRLVADTPETRPVAWAFERDDGGLSFAFTGGHYLATLDQPDVRRMLLDAIFWTARLDVPRDGVRSGVPDLATRIARAAEAAVPASIAPRGIDTTTFHQDAGRSGWRARETVLTPRNVAGASFGAVWSSPPLDAVDGQAPRLYASPLYVDRVTMSAGPYRGMRFATVFAASSNGFAYAINAAPAGDVAAGRILWRTRLDAPCRLQPAPLDGVPTGILSTPVIDVERQRLYVTHCDPVQRWQAYALDLTSGALLPGWPVRLDEETLNNVNANAGPERVPPKRRFDFRVQRGALNLSPDGSLLYVTFGETETGWLAAVDTHMHTVRSAFATVAMPHRGSGGLWGAGGAAVDADGSVYVATGTGFDGYVDQSHDWTQSLLKLAPPQARGFAVSGTYTPFNYCRTANADIDLGSGGVALMPVDATARKGSLLAIGGKQGNVYLLDRDRLPGALDRRPTCITDASRDGSLLPPQPQAHFGRRGPLNVFGPYSEKDAAMDLARARSVPAFFRDARGVDHVFVTGNTREREGSEVAVPPSIVRLDVVDAPSPYLRVAREERSLILKNPGSPVVTSNGARDAIVWVLDENASRSASLSGADAPRPVLYAFDADTLAVLWKSAPDALHTSGKYNEPAFGGGRVFVGTDRIQAFGLDAPRTLKEDEPAPERVVASEPAAVVQAAQGPIAPAAIYRSRCAVCHDHPEGNIPPRALIATRSEARIVEVLTRGAMRAQASGLSNAEIESLARYLR